jgi:type VI secretion system protein ImpH
VAAPGRRTDPSIEDALFGRGYNFEFFQAVRLLARVFPHRRPVGSTSKPSEEIVRFGASTVDAETGKPICMEFPPSAIHEIEHVPDSSDPVRMTVAFMGLTGTQGVLPFYYTDRMLARKIVKDGAMAAFFDIFNHRFVSLFYRAWKKYQHPVLYESAGEHALQPDTFTHSLFDLIGMGTISLRGRMRIADESLLLYAGLIAQRPHSASALRGILQDYFAVPVEIDQCLGSWYELEEQDRCYLNAELGRNQLGEAAFLGDGVWNQQSRFRIRVGPLALEKFVEFLPDGDALSRLIEFTTYIAGQAIVFEVQVSLRAAEVPYCRLDDEGLDAPRLGWMGWLKTGEFTADAGDAVFEWVN